MEAPKILIKSDFRDYYDHAFASRFDYNKVWTRNATDTVTRLEWFDRLTYLGVSTVPYGTMNRATALRGTLFSHNEGRRFVVYDNKMAHRGEGKRLVGYDEALEMSLKRKSLLFSLYIEPEEEGVAKSTRMLRIGNVVYMLTYVNRTGDWRSNVVPGGDADDIQISAVYFTEGDENPSYLMRIKSPCLAVDFVYDTLSRTYLAMDVNTSPSWRWTPLEDTLAPSRVYELVCAWEKNKYVVDAKGEGFG